MNRWIFSCVAAAVVLFGEHVSGQVQMHDDYGGFTLRAGNLVQVQRNNGYSSTYYRSGNVELYNNNLGTSGSTFYLPSGRFYNYSNPYAGWSGSGFAPHYGGSTYQRTYNAPTLPTPTYNPYYRSYYGR